MTSSNPTETHLIQHTSSIVAPQWTEVTNVIFCGGPVGEGQVTSDGILCSECIRKG